jgi:hypothetical protein
MKSNKPLLNKTNACHPEPGEGLMIVGQMLI